MNTVKYKTIPLKSSLKNNILLTFFLIFVFSAIANNLIFLSVIQDTLTAEGLNPRAIENISRQFTVIGSSITIIGILSIFLIARFFSETITRPLNKLTNGMIDIAKGDWNTRIDLSSSDEVGQLADGFNFMAKHIEESLIKLKSAKEYTDNIFISVPSILIVLNNRTEVLSTNIAFDKLHQQFPALAVRQFVNGLQAEIQENMMSGEIIHKEIVLIPEGSEIKLTFSAIVSRIGESLREAEDDEPRVLLTITDITERKIMKELVMQSKQDWEDTFNTIPDMMTIHDKDFNIIHANIHAKEILNLPLLDPGRINKCFKYYHGTETAPEGCPSCDCMKTGEAATFELFEPHLNKFIEIRAIPRINNNGELIGLIHIVRDISLRKKIEHERDQLLADITKAKIEWELTFDSAMEFIVLIDNSMNITRCNKSFADFFKRPVDKIIGHKCYDFFPCSEDVAGECKKNLTASKELSLKNEVKTESGNWLYISHRPIHDQQSKTLHSVIIATDITGLKNAQQRIKESESELKTKVEDLEKFYDLAIGREIRMKELKKEIKKVSAKLEFYERNTLVKK